MSEQLTAEPREHVLGAECWCHPRREYVPGVTEGDDDA
jgi:hypothetical protein